MSSTKRRKIQSEPEREPEAEPRVDQWFRLPAVICEQLFGWLPASEVLQLAVQCRYAQTVLRPYGAQQSCRAHVIWLCHSVGNRYGQRYPNGDRNLSWSKTSRRSDSSLQRAVALCQTPHGRWVVDEVVNLAVQQIVHLARQGDSDNPSGNAWLRTLNAVVSTCVTRRWPLRQETRRNAAICVTQAASRRGVQDGLKITADRLCCGLGWLQDLRPFSQARLLWTVIHAARRDNDPHLSAILTALLAIAPLTRDPWIGNTLLQRALCDPGCHSRELGLDQRRFYVPSADVIAANVKLARRLCDAGYKPPDWKEMNASRAKMWRHTLFYSGVMTHSIVIGLMLHLARIHRALGSPHRGHRKSRLVDLAEAMTVSMETLCQLYPTLCSRAVGTYDTFAAAIDDQADQRPLVSVVALPFRQRLVDILARTQSALETCRK